MLAVAIGGVVLGVEVDVTGWRTGMLVLLQHSTTTFNGPCGGGGGGGGGEGGGAAVKFFTSFSAIKRTIDLISSKSIPLGPGGPGGPGRPSAPFLPG